MFDQSLGGVNPHRKLAAASVLPVCKGFDVFELSTCPGIELFKAWLIGAELRYDVESYISAHLRRIYKRDFLQAIAQTLAVRLRLIRERSVRFRDDDRETK